MKERVKKRVLGCEGDSVGACPTPNPSECELFVKIRKMLSYTYSMFGVVLLSSYSACVL